MAAQTAKRRAERSRGERFPVGKSPTQSRQPLVRRRAVRHKTIATDIKSGTDSRFARPPPVARQAVGLENWRVAKHRQMVRALATASGAIAPSRIVEPKHWHLACRRSPSLQDEAPNCGASIRFGELKVAAREVPQSAPERSEGSDYRNNRRHQGVEPVRFSNGQQQT